MVQISDDKVVLELTEPEFKILKEIVKEQTHKTYEEKCKVENKHKDYSVVLNKLLDTEEQNEIRKASSTSTTKSNVKPSITVTTRSNMCGV